MKGDEAPRVPRRRWAVSGNNEQCVPAIKAGEGNEQATMTRLTPEPGDDPDNLRLVRAGQGRAMQWPRLSMPSASVRYALPVRLGPTTICCVTRLALSQLDQHPWLSLYAHSTVIHGTTYTYQSTSGGRQLPTGAPQLAAYRICGEHIRMVDLARIVGFDWDAGPARKSEKHGVSMVKSGQVFNAPLLTIEDTKHSAGEARFHALCKTDEERQLQISLT